MPAQHPKYGDYTWKNVRDTGRILRFKCGGCGRVMFYDPKDLITVFGDQDFHMVPFPCSTCGHGRFIDVAMYSPADSDVGKLTIRRPVELRPQWVWKTMKLGDPIEVKGGQ